MSDGPVLPGLGGGIGNTGSLIITNSTVSGNSVSGGGAGIVNFGALTITNSTISGNTAFPAGNGVPASGGGISHSGNSLLLIANSTISGNSVPDRGGGILSSGPLTITNSTISDNENAENAGAIDNSGSLQIANTILKAGASGATIFNSSGTVTSLGYNLSSDNGGGFLAATGDLINTDPILGQLQNNGGPTFTHALTRPRTQLFLTAPPPFVWPPGPCLLFPGHGPGAPGPCLVFRFPPRPPPPPRAARRGVLGCRCCFFGRRVRGRGKPGGTGA